MCDYLLIQASLCFPGADSESVIEQYPLGLPLVQTIAPHTYLRTQLYMPHPQTVHYNVTVPEFAVIGVYGRRNVEPSPVQYDFFHVVDGSMIENRRDRYKRNTKVNFLKFKKKT